MAETLPAVQDPNDILKKLSTSLSSYQAPSGWAHDSAYENTANSIQRGLANLTSQNQQATQRIGEDYEINREQAGKYNEQNLKSLQNKLANQGIGYSGVNISEQGRLGEEFQTALTGLERGKTRNLEELAFNSAQQASEWQNQLSAAQADRANRQAEKEKEQAALQAQAEAAKNAADQQRQWMESLQQRLTSLAQPQPTPTGQLNPPPPPQQIVQQAVRQLPPPAAKTPQQQAQEAGINPRELQQLLTQRGFSTGPVDGVMGIKTQRALAQWKQSVGLPATADITPEIFQQLISTGIGNMGARGIATAGPAKRAF
jgi:hypothetical protein